MSQCTKETHSIKCTRHLICTHKNIKNSPVLLISGYRSFQVYTRLYPRIKRNFLHSSINFSVPLRYLKPWFLKFFTINKLISLSQFAFNIKALYTEFTLGKNVKHQHLHWVDCLLFSLWWTMPLNLHITKTADSVTPSALIPH